MGSTPTGEQPAPGGEMGLGFKAQGGSGVYEGILLGTPNREPQEYSRYIIGIYLPGSLYSIIFLLYSWGSLFGVPSRVPLFYKKQVGCEA